MNTVKSNNESGTKKPHPAPDPTRPEPQRPDTRIPVKPDEDNDFTFPTEPAKEPQDKGTIEDPDNANQERQDAPGNKNNSGRAPFNDPTLKGDPGRIDPSAPGNPVLSGRGNFTSWFYILLISISLMLPATVSANDKKPAKTEVSAEAQVLINRLEEIKSMDKSEMTTVEKKSLRKEVREIKEKLRELSGGVYLSVGAVIIIILLLILLL